jgi:hypothetical protein
MLHDDHPWIQAYFHGPRGRAAQHAEPGQRPQTEAGITAPVSA